jgi:lysophospholipase L1-like esterase
MSGRVIVLIVLSAVAAAASAFAAALLFVPGFDAGIRWRLHLEDRGYGSFGARLHNDHLLHDLSVGDGRIVVIGDSHAAGLDEARLGALAVNYGIGGDTMLGVSKRMLDYQAVRSARAIVLIAGYNDLRYRTPADVGVAFSRVREQVGSTPLYVVSVMPERGDARVNAEIPETNELLRNACAGSCRFIDVATRFKALAPEEQELLHLADGIHLTPFGYELAIEAIAAALCADGVYGEAQDVCA